uniref:Bombesin receptor-activated protein C6orf89 homolog n=1 Tax=Sinocyclocheilus rhinocerous TaxID=307959 RepID=A0A673N3K3_9TELE
MGSSLSEPCIYDKLSESIDILIRRRHTHQTQSDAIRHNQTPSDNIRHSQTTSDAVRHNQTPSDNIRRHQTTSDAIRHRQTPSDTIRHRFHEWWASGAPQTPQVNCSACADVTAVLELRVSAAIDRHTQPLLLKGGESLSRRVSHLEQFSQPQTLTATPANFTLLWSFSSSPRETLLQWLFPDTELCPLLENTGTTLQCCQLSDSTSVQHTRVQVLGWLVVAEGSPWVRVLPIQRCQTHCRSFSLWLEPGDMVLADPRYWLLELFASGAQRVLCDGPVL